MIQAEMLIVFYFYFNVLFDCHDLLTLQGPQFSLVESTINLIKKCAKTNKYEKIE